MIYFNILDQSCLSLEFTKICAPFEAKNRFLAISSKISILGYMLLNKSDINVTIANILNGQINFLDPITKIIEFCAPHEAKTVFFLAVSSKISILGDMLLHNSDINVAIANILVYRHSLCDFPELGKMQKFEQLLRLS